MLFFFLVDIGLTIQCTIVLVKRLGLNPRCWWDAYLGLRSQERNYGFESAATSKKRETAKED